MEPRPEEIVEEYWRQRKAREEAFLSRGPADASDGGTAPLLLRLDEDTARRLLRISWQCGRSIEEEALAAIKAYLEWWDAFQRGKTQREETP